jgi:hypothetical protein
MSAVGGATDNSGRPPPDINDALRRRGCWQRIENERCETKVYAAD